MLVKLERDFNEAKPEEPWQRFYARGLIAHFQPVAAR
jgi:hypothetical protein